MCAIKDCKRKCIAQRISLEMSEHLFQTTSEYIPAGSGNLIIRTFISKISLEIGVCKTHKQDFKAARLPDTIQSLPEQPTTPEMNPGLVQIVAPRFEGCVEEESDSGLVQIDSHGPIGHVADNLSSVLDQLAPLTPERHLADDLVQIADYSPLADYLVSGPVQKNCSSFLPGDAKLRCSDTDVQTDTISLVRESSDCRILRTESSDSNLTDSQTSNWSSSSENQLKKIQTKVDKKSDEILKVSNLYESLGFDFPSSLKVGVDPKVS